MSSSSSSSTNILEMSDECLKTVFQHLKVNDLCAVADVCTYFRRKARSYAECVQSKFTTQHFQNTSDAQKLLKRSRLLRNFGTHVKVVHFQGEDKEVSQSKHQNKTLKLLSTYCSGTLVELYLLQCDMTDEIALMMWPVFQGLQKLSIIGYHVSELFLKMLPSCAPDLHELSLGFIENKIDKRQVALFDGLHQSFEKLMSFTIMNAAQVKKNDIENFMTLNPQLKKIQINYCQNIDDGILRSIAAHATQVESLRFDALQIKDLCTAKYFGQLKNLNMLEISVSSKNNAAFLTSALREIGAGQVPLKHLMLQSISFCDRTIVSFIDAIATLKNLKTLRLCLISGLNWNNIQNICKQLSELTELYLPSNRLILTASGLLETIQNAEKLEQLHFWNFYMNEEEKSCLDVDFFLKMVEILSARRERIRLVLSLSSSAYVSTSAQIPNKLIRKYHHLLSMESLT